MGEILFDTLECGVELTSLIREMQRIINTTSVFFQAEVLVRPEGGGMALRIKNGKHDRILICIRNESESVFIRAVEKRGDLRQKTPWVLYQKMDETGNQIPFLAPEVATFAISSLQHLRDTTTAQYPQALNRLLASFVTKMVMQYLSDKNKVAATTI